MYTEKQDRPKANWTNCSLLGPAFLDYLFLAVQVHTTKQCSFWKFLALDPAPPKVGHADKYPLPNEGQIMLRHIHYSYL